MAHKKVLNYTVSKKNKKIFADVGKLTEEEINIVKNYTSLGYELVNKELKKGVSKEQMLKELASDEDAKKDFETAYSIKKDEIEDKADIINELAVKYGIKTKTKAGNDIIGYHLACQIYTKWSKKNKKEKENKK